MPFTQMPVFPHERWSVGVKDSNGGRRQPERPAAKPASSLLNLATAPIVGLLYSGGTASTAAATP